jgi:son of sevenless-like protein
MATNVTGAQEDQYITTFFCRALYDYQTQDSSSLSFQRNDVIEVLTRLESGWWDGLLGDERGWFPSNYVTVISDEEAEAALSGSEYSTRRLSTFDSMADGSNSTVTAGQSVNGNGWQSSEIGDADSRNGLVELTNAASEDCNTPASDFWVPQVTAEGAVSSRPGSVGRLNSDNFFQIFYVNTQTGQISRDLPTETEEEVSEGDLAGLPPSQGTSHVGMSASAGFGSSYTTSAGFGLSKHTDISEPWVRKLADDGMSYYFTNRETGEIRWTIPEPEMPFTHAGRLRAATNSSMSSSQNGDTISSSHRLRSDSPASLSHQGSESSADRVSLCSDDSDTQRPPTNGHKTLDWDSSVSLELVEYEKVAVELTSAELLAKSLQKALSPPEPDSLADLSATARQAITAVIECIQANDISRFLGDDTTLDGLVCTVVISIRNLLYVSAAPSGHIPSNVILGTRYTRDRRNTTASQALLKPAQRKVTATLSKLVLSARAIQYNSGSSIVDTPIRIEGDAEELERAVSAFVLEVQRSQSRQLHSGMGLKRLRGVFSTSHIGLGLVGAGAAGSWKGLGWVSLEETDEAPGRILGTEVVTELRAYIVQVQENFISFGSSIKQLINEAGKSHSLLCYYCCAYNFIIILPNNYV